MQGRLLEEKLEIIAVTVCAVSRRELRLQIDSDMNCRVLTEGAEPLVFEPHIDWQNFSAPSIVDDY